jgi:hypothetical protein
MINLQSKVFQTLNFTWRSQVDWPGSTSLFFKVYITYNNQAMGVYLVHSNPSETTPSLKFKNFHVSTNSGVCEERNYWVMKE